MAFFMRLLFLGDMVGRTGRTAVWEKLPGLISDFRLDFVIVNGENAAGGCTGTPCQSWVSPSIGTSNSPHISGRGLVKIVMRNCLPQAPVLSSRERRLID